MSSPVTARSAVRAAKVAIAGLCERLSPALWLKSRIWRRDRYFEREFFFLGTLCDPRRASVDVGGNAGHFAHWLSYHSKHVYTYEPNPVCQRQLVRVLRANVTLRPVALSDRAGTVPLVYERGNTGIGSIATENPIFDRASEPGFTTITVPTVRLDEDLTEPVGLIKIDVEGHEATVLAGAVRLMARDRPHLMVEVEERHRAGAHDRVREQLEPLGYLRFHLAGERLVPLPWDQDATALQRTPGSPDYINNFFFIHREEAAGVAAIAASLLSARQGA